MAHSDRSPPPGGPDVPGSPDLTGVTVIFDLDGTLVDTARDLVRALNHVMRADGVAEVSLDDVRQMVGRGSRALIRRAYARQGFSLPEPLMDERQAAFLTAYEAGIADLSRPFPGAVETLDALKAAGAVSVIATNKPHGLTMALMRELGWQDRFAKIVGADAAPQKKPHASHLETAAGGRENLKRAIMIGDSSVDVAAARAAGVPVAVVRHGYSETPVEQLGADRVMDQLTETLDAAAELTAAASPGRPS